MATAARNTTFTFWAKPNFAKLVKTEKHYRGYYNSALLYAHYELSYANLKKETTQYARRSGKSAELQAALKDIPDVRFSVIGKYHYILNHGGELPDDVMAGLDKYLIEIVETAQRKTAKAAAIAEDKAAEPPEPKITVQDRIRDKARMVACEIDIWLDELFAGTIKEAKPVSAFVSLFKEHDLKAVHMSHMQQCFVKTANEIRELKDTKDKQLIEGYSHITKACVKALITFYDNLDTACDMMRDVAKAERAPRARRAVSTDKLVAKLKYKKDDASLGVASVAPTALLGVKEVWVYNTKTRKISRYVADELQGPITVKGAVLVGFDAAKSQTKTLRKPKEQLAQFKKSSKTQLRNFLRDITTVDTPATGRINEDCILLRADK